MTDTLTIILLTALLSALITTGLMALLLKALLLPRLQDSFEENILPSFQARVRKGMIEAGDELLPKFRENVHEGFNDAIRDAVGGKVLEDTARGVAKTMETGLETLFRKR